MWIGHRKEIRKLTFQALALRRSEVCRKINLHEQFTTSKKCCEKFECIVYEMMIFEEKESKSGKSSNLPEESEPHVVEVRN